MNGQQRDKMPVLPLAYIGGDCMRGDYRADEDCCPGTCDFTGGGAGGKGPGNTKKFCSRDWQICPIAAGLNIKYELED